MRTSDIYYIELECVRGNQLENNNQGNGPMSYNNAQNSANQPSNMSQQGFGIRDYGNLPVVFDMETMTKMNDKFRTVLWTGTYMQIVLMSIKPGEDIGIEIHPDMDQFIRIEEGDGLVQMGSSRDNLNFSQIVEDDDSIIIPAGAWHNVSNTGDVDMKLYTIYAPPHYAYGLVQETKEEADMED